MYYCGYCGGQLNPGYDVCPHCGRKNELIVNWLFQSNDPPQNTSGSNLPWWVIIAGWIIVGLLILFLK